jgi:uncharacterized protein (DUF2141 family)
MMRLTRVVVLLTLPAAGIAQQRPPGRTIVGVVTDTAGRPLDSAEVFIPSLRRTTAADTNGRFRFNDIKPGNYQVAVRRLGFYPQRKDAVVTQDTGAAVSFTVVPLVTSLAPVVSAARRGGLSGVVGDTAYNAIRDAEVIESNATKAITDSMGAFFTELRTGRHFVRFKREGYVTQLVSVTMPKDSGRRVAVFLRPGKPSVREAIAQSNMEFRLNRRSAAHSTLFTREDIQKGPWIDGQQLAQSAAAKSIGPECAVIIDGGPRSELLWAIRASEIEAMEVYRPKPARATVTSINGGGKAITTQGISEPQAGFGCNGHAVYVWLRK